MSSSSEGPPVSPEEEAALRAQVKAEIRKRIGIVRRAIPAEARDSRSAAICQRTLELAELTTASVVLGYVAFRGEVSPARVLEAVRARGAATALPRVRWSDDTLTLHRVEGDATLEESGLGFLQPPEDAPLVDPATIEVVLVPCVAADHRGQRIGSGRGHYDRLLPQLTRAARIGLAYDFQIVPEVPDEPHDARLHTVVTDHEVIVVP